MEKICDLHTHSVFSDGTFTPTEILHAAGDIGLAAVALCDHNTVDGLPEFLSAASRQNIEAVAGAEFSVDYEGTELHLLGLFLPPPCFSQIAALMTDVHKRKEQSNIDLIDSLNQAGFHINYLAIKNKSPNGKINRAHIAAELTATGYTASIHEAFETLLSKTGGHYSEPKRLTVWEMINFINDIGAAPVLAHPLLNLSEKQLLTFLPKAKKAGLTGMECYYSLYDAEATAKSIAMADAFGLKHSGGSDFHGTIKPDIKLGFGKGNLRIPYLCAENIRP